MTTTFRCDHCGGENEYAGQGDSLHCAYCGSTLPVPAEMVTAAQSSRFLSKARTWIIVFILLVFVIPACLSLAGTLLGLFGSLIGFIAALFGSIAPFFIGH